MNISKTKSKSEIREVTYQQAMGKHPWTEGYELMRESESWKIHSEVRELEAELEAARDFEEQFGTGGRSRRAKKNAGVKDQGSDDDDDGDEGEKEDGDKAEGAKRPGGRLLPKGLVDFGDSGDDGSD